MENHSYVSLPEGKRPIDVKVLGFRWIWLAKHDVYYVYLTKKIGMKPICIWIHGKLHCFTAVFFVAEIQG